MPDAHEPDTADLLRAVIQDLLNEAAFHAPVGFADPAEICHDDHVTARALREYADRLRKHPAVLALAEQQAAPLVGVGSVGETVALALGDAYAGEVFRDSTFEIGTQAVVDALSRAGYLRAAPGEDVNWDNTKLRDLADWLVWIGDRAEPAAAQDYGATDVDSIIDIARNARNEVAPAAPADDYPRDKIRDRLHGIHCGCGEWDSHSQEYVDSMDRTIDAVLWRPRTSGGES